MKETVAEKVALEETWSLTSAEFRRGFNSTTYYQERYWQQLQQGQIVGVERPVNHDRYIRPTATCAFTDRLCGNRLHKEFNALLVPLHSSSDSLGLCVVGVTCRSPLCTSKELCPPGKHWGRLDKGFPGCQSCEQLQPIRTSLLILK